MKKILLFSVIIAIIVSCSSNETNERSDDLIKKIYYKSGDLKGIIRFNEERQLDGEIEEFYKSGNYKSIYNYSAGELYGFSKEFYDKIDTVIGKDDSGDTMLYKTPCLKTLMAFNSRGNIVFKLSYDEEGHVTESIGRTIIQMSKWKHLNLNQKQKICELFVPLPPYTNSRFYFNTKALNKENILKSDSILNPSNQYVEYNTNFEKEGKYKLEVVSEITQKSSGFQMVDTVNFIFEVSN